MEDIENGGSFAGPITRNLNLHAHWKEVQYELKEGIDGVQADNNVYFDGEGTIYIHYDEEITSFGVASVNAVKILKALEARNKVNIPDGNVTVIEVYSDRVDLSDIDLTGVQVVFTEKGILTIPTSCLSFTIPSGYTMQDFYHKGIDKIGIDYDASSGKITIEMSESGRQAPPH